MDFTQLIQKKLEELKTFRDTEGIDSVLHHLDISERHFHRGRDEDTDFFTDAIYRTNQVFEGILKEAFQILAQSNSRNKTPNQIEQYLEKNKIFSERVRTYFTRYRKDWRNPSAHDHRLDFDEQEAFLAISTVAAFCYVAIDQMIQKLAEGSVLETTSEDAFITDREREEITSGNVRALAQAIIRVLPETLKDLSTSHESGRISEVALVGALTGVIKSIIPEAGIDQAPVLQGDTSTLRPDIIVRLKNSVIVIEVRQMIGDRMSLFGITRQLIKYVDSALATSGIGITLPGITERMLSELTLSEVIHSGHPIVLIHSKDVPNLQ